MTNDEITIEDILADEKYEFISVHTPDRQQDENEIDEIGTTMISSDYIAPSDFRDLITKHKIRNENFITIVSLNIANVISKLRDLKLFLSEITTPENKIDIIALSETHITEGKTPMNENDLRSLISGYTFINVGRKTKQGGGVGCFISNDIVDQVERCPGESQEEVFESLFLRIKGMITRDAKRYSKDVVLGILYRQPNNANHNAFLSELEKRIKTYDKPNTELVLVGDTNLNLLNYTKHEPTAKYLDIMLQNNLITRITKPTRIKHKSATLIDVILTKDNELAKHSGILLREIKGNHGYTDHLPVFTILSIKTEKKKRPAFLLKEYITKQNRTARREALRRQNWSEIHQEQNPNEIFDKLQSLYGNHYYANVTKKLVKNDCYNVKTEPWMREDIMKDIRKRDKLVKIKSKRKEYKNIRNQIVKNSREAEKDYLRDKIMENWNNMKEQWKIINNITGRLNNKNDIIDCFLHDGKWVENEGENAENFNRYYANVGRATEGDIGPGKKSPSSYLKDHCPINPEKLLFSENVGEDVIKACKK